MKCKDNDGFAAMLACPLSLQLAPARFSVLDDAGANYAVYVEPPKAPGLAQVIPVLRRKVKAHFEADRAAADYSGLAAHGLKADRKTRSIVECDKMNSIGA